MSGYARTIYDQCAVTERNRRSIEPGNRSLFSGTHTNPQFNKQTSVICPSNEGCVRMAQPNSTMGVGPDDIPKRIDLSNMLRGTERMISKCSCKGWSPCSLNCGKTADCPNVVPFNPLLNERNLFPTNMNVDYEQGFGNSKY